jgi:hypothetical protein
LRPVRLAYQPPASSTFLSQQTSHQQPASSTLLSEQTSTSHQPPANRTGCWSDQVNSYDACLFLGQFQLEFYGSKLEKVIFDHSTLAKVWFWSSNSKTGYLRSSNYQNRSNLAIRLFFMGGFNCFYLQFSS